jgi:hypothetical protein
MRSIISSPNRCVGGIIGIATGTGVIGAGAATGIAGTGAGTAITGTVIAGEVFFVTGTVTMVA